ncbi:ATP-dependent Zn protease [Stappia aggregata IAM 12614]
MARMAVRRALRQCLGLHRRSAYILGVELPNDIDTKLYEEALEYEFQSVDPDGPGKRACPEFHYFIDERGKSRYRRKEPFESYSIGMSITEHQRLIGIGTPKHPITDVFRNIAEAVIEVRPTRRHLQAAALIARGFHLSDHIADELIAHNIACLSIAFRGNRPLKAALGMLEALAAAEASITPKRRDDAETPPLEEMSGYGEAKEWGLVLVRDLKDWSEGALPWSDVDQGILLLGGPGTGKTIFAKALARSCGATFVECSLSKTQALGHLGDMLKGINKAFSEARSNTPAILFLDEFDGVGNRETLSRHAPEYATQVITGLLELMDGSEKRDGVVIVAACNRL